MLRVENIVFEGRCFLPVGTDVNNLSKVKSTITDFMRMKRYVPEDPLTLLFQDRFLSMSFFLHLHPGKRSTVLKIKKALGLLSEGEFRRERYYEQLKLVRDDYPFKVTFNIIPGKRKGIDGFEIYITSEPAILYKIRQLGIKVDPDEFLYSSIAVTNKQFIRDVMRAIGSIVISEPRALSEIVTTPLIGKLKEIELKDIARLLKSGRIKMERGDIEDGLTDLRASIQIFFEHAVERIGKKPSKYLKENLKKLEKETIIYGYEYKLINNIIYEWLYDYLSHVPVHQREKIKLSTARLLFSLSEKCIEYMIERVFLRL